MSRVSSPKPKQVLVIGLGNPGLSLAQQAWLRSQETLGFLRSPSSSSGSLVSSTGKTSRFSPTPFWQPRISQALLLCMINKRPSLILIIGLGNPGLEYEKTRHNAGRSAVTKWQKKEGLPEFAQNPKQQALVSEGKIGRTKVVGALPETFMNKSGIAVGALAKYYKAKPEHIVVVHDDADLPLGTLKIVFNRGSGGHKGVESVMRALKTEAFVRIRIGIGKNTKWHERDLNKVVIGKFTPQQQTLFFKGMRKAIEALSTIAQEGRERAMNGFNK